MSDMSSEHGAEMERLLSVLATCDSIATSATGPMSASCIWPWTNVSYGRDPS